MKRLSIILIAFSLIFTACSTTSNISDENFIEPVLKIKPNLIYPVSAQKNNHWGIAEVLFNISEEGKVTETRIKKSSGYKDLDKTAVNYCKGFIFTPAKLNGNPIEYGMRLEIKFNLEDLKDDIIGNVDNMLDLYSEESQSFGNRKLFIQNEILDYHSFIINKINDCQKFNEYVYGVVSKDVKKDWQKVADSCPLSFLLYHDFLTRYENSEIVDTAKSLLEYSIQQDLNYLEITEDREIIKNKSNIIKKIVKFVEKNYPNISLDYLDLSTRGKNDIS